MKNKDTGFVLAIIPLICAFIGLLNHGFTFAVYSFVISIVLEVLLYPFAKKWLYNNELKSYARQIENIYEYSEGKTDKEVFARAEYHRKKLTESGNKLHVKVFEIYFQDSKNVNENWEEFEARKDLFISDDKQKRHTYLNNLGRKFYKAEILHQSGINY